MRYAWIFLFLFPFCLQAQLSGRIDSLGRKQGKFQEKMLFSGYPDSLKCIVRYQDGKRAASCDCVLENGAKAVTGTYRNNGIKDGNWTFWNPDGTMNYRIWYDENGEVSDRYYYVYVDNETNSGEKRLQQIIQKDKNDSLISIEYYNDKKLTKIKYASGHTVKTPAGKVNFRGEWAVTAGYTYQNNHWLELAVKKFSYGNDGDDLSVLFTPKNYMMAGAEVGIDKNKKAELAPKLGVGVHFFLFNVNLNGILYNDQFQQLYPAITPEIGISSPYGIIQIDYGYNIFLVANKFMPNETHRVSVRITIPFFDTGYP